MVMSNSGNSIDESLNFWVRNLCTPQREHGLTSSPPKRKSNSEHKPVKRPMNAFMVFSQSERQRIKDLRKNSNIPWNNIEISIQLGERWRQLSAVEKAPYVAEADRLKRIHNAEHPEYKYEPRKRKKRSKKVTETESACEAACSPDVSSLSTPSNCTPTPHNNSYNAWNLCENMSLHSALPNQTSLGVRCQPPPIILTPKFHPAFRPKVRLPIKRTLSSQSEPAESCTVLKRLLRPEPKEEVYNSSVHPGPSFCEQCTLYNQSYLHPICYTTSQNGQSCDYIDLDESTESFNKENDNGMNPIPNGDYFSFPSPTQNLTTAFCRNDVFSPFSSCFR